MTRRRGARSAVIAVVTGLIVVLLAALVVAGGGDSTAPVAPISAEPVGTPNIATIAASALPKQGHDTLALIAAGGPFPYKQDDGLFANREGRLPKQSRTYYREYTVKTPGAGNRGARRIVTGSRGERYYSADHYETFHRIVAG